ncbi:flagellar brake protein [Thauera butanivorans]|uniref:flagellar brake protein n=1 Tax=Thauera butanivorans TaxID=86174 RepID=UPI0008384C65|nr:flagellar brake protein [Thauera butanivorans]
MTSPDADNTPTPIDMDRRDAIEQFILGSRRQVLQLLQELIEHRALISGHFGNGRSFLTALLEISDDEETLVLDASPDPEANRRILAAPKLVCVTQFEHIRIQFALHDLREGREDGRSLFLAPVPREMLRLQRRAAYRLSVPLSHAATGQIGVKSAAGTPATLAGRLLDISVGGIALQLPPDAARLVIGEQLQDCRLQLPNLDPIVVQLRVCYLDRQEQRSGSQMLRVGFAFVDLPHKIENTLQRYIFNTDRERAARERGGL